MLNKSIDFKGTGKIFLELEREVLPGSDENCDACGRQLIRTYFKFGMVNCDKLPYNRVHSICPECHKALTA